MRDSVTCSILPAFKACEAKIVICNLFSLISQIFVAISF